MKLNDVHYGEESAVRKLREWQINTMCKYKSFFPISPILLIFIALGVIGGCSEEKKLCGTGNNCHVHFSGPICNIDLMNCKQISKSGYYGGEGRCGGYQFTEKPTKYCPDGNECKLKCCPLCSPRSAIRFDQEFTELESPLTILSIDQTCDVITKGKFSPISNEDCENLANYRVCKSFDFIPSEEDHLVSQCLLYECEDCLLDEFEFNEDFVD